MSRHRFCPNLPFLGGAIAFIALCALSGTRVEASCGDWLDSHQVAVPESTQPEGGPLLPCRGPECGEAPPQPSPAVPLSISVQQQERLCILSGSAEDAQNGCRFLPPSADAALPEIIRDRIDRPPRRG